LNLYQSLKYVNHEKGNNNKDRYFKSTTVMYGMRPFVFGIRPKKNTNKRNCKKTSKYPVACRNVFQNLLFKIAARYFQKVEYRV